MSYSSIVRFSPGTITPKLNSRFLIKPPTPNDWMHQTYIQMIQDLSYATSHYYESNENGTGLLSFATTNKITPAFDTTETIEKILSETDNNLKSATLHNHYYNYDDDYTPNIIALHSSASPHVINKKSNNNTISPLSLHEYHNNEYNSNDNDTNNNTEGEEDDDDQSASCHTYTTSSTDCNRRNNIYRFYRGQQNLARPIDKEELLPTIKIVAPYGSSSNNEKNNDSNSRSEHNNISIIDSTSSPVNNKSICITVTQEKDIKVNQHNNKGKKLKLFKSMMTKMKMAAENPFWAIDNHF